MRIAEHGDVMGNSCCAARGQCSSGSKSNLASTEKNETVVALKWPLHTAWRHQSAHWGQHSETGARRIYNSCPGDDGDGNSGLGT